MAPERELQWLAALPQARHLDVEFKNSNKFCPWRKNVTDVNGGGIGPFGVCSSSFPDEAVEIVSIPGPQQLTH